jgi:hypothetical protein
VPAETLVEIYQRHEQKKATAHNFNKGTTECWRSEMSPEDQQLCREAFGPDLSEMGYPVQ